MPKAKFVSQRRKKQKFYGNRFTNRRNYDVKRGLDEENSSACLEDEINWSSTQVDNKAKETLSASYCKLKSVTEGNNPVDKPKKVTRTMRNTRDGELTTMYGKQISKVLFLPWTLKFLTVYSGGLWNYITCGIQKLMEMVTAKVLAGFRMSRDMSRNARIGENGRNVN